MLNLNFLPQGVRLKEKLALASKMMDPWGKNPGVHLPVGSTPRKLVFSEGGLQIYYYAPLPEKKHETPILIVPSLINRYYVLDLLPGKSFIEYLSRQQGYPVYVIEWGVPEDEDRYLTLERFVAGRLRRAVDAVLKREAVSSLHFFGHCLGGTFGALFAIRNPDLIASMTLLTAPVNFQVGGQLSVWTTYSNFDVDAFVEAYGNVPWPLMQASFHMLKPASGVAKYLKLLGRVLQDGPKALDPNFMKSFWALEIWSSDNVSYPGEFYKALIKQFYRENALINGTLEIDGQAIRLQDMTFPVLNIAGAGDHIVPPESTLNEEYLGANSGVSLTSWVVDGGHLGCFIGKKAQEKVWPQLVNWLESQEAPALSV